MSCVPRMPCLSVTVELPPALPCKHVSSELDASTDASVPRSSAAAAHRSAAARRMCFERAPLREPALYAGLQSAGVRCTRPARSGVAVGDADQASKRHVWLSPLSCACARDERCQAQAGSKAAQPNCKASVGGRLQRSVGTQHRPPQSVPLPSPYVAPTVPQVISRPCA